MNLGEILGRMNVPLQLPAQPMETYSSQTHPWLEGVNPLPPGQQVQQGREQDQQRRNIELQAIAKRMGNLGGWAAEPGILQPHTVGKRQPGMLDKILAKMHGKEAKPSGALGTYDPILDNVNTYNYQDERRKGRESLAGDVSPLVKPHEFTHRAFRQYGVEEMGNRLIDAYREKFLQEDSPEFTIMQAFEKYIAENPSVQTMDNRGSDLFATEFLSNNTLMAKWAKLLNQYGEKYFSNPANEARFNRNYFTKAFE